jgi:pimeloyl-ACP methyl ester carboxylesterase
LFFQTITGSGAVVIREDFFQREAEVFHYLDWGGQGPLAYLAHATGMCAGTYSPLADKMLSFLRVIGMDDRGHGRTRATADPKALKNWDIFVEDLERFVEFLQEPVIPIGHSRGGVVGLYLAVKRPDLVRALVLLDPTILPFSWMWWWYLAKKAGLAKYVPIAARAARRRAVWPDEQSIRETYLTKSSFRHWQEGFLESYLACGCQPTGEGTVRLTCDPAWESKCFSVCPHDVWGYIPRITCPVLVIYGEQSDTFLASAAKRMKRLNPQTVLQGFPGTGHFVPMERPQEVSAAIFKFLIEKGILP